MITKLAAVFSSCRTFYAMYPEGLRGAQFVAELVAAVDFHDDRPSFYPLLKSCDANCYGLDSYYFGVRGEVECSPAAWLCIPENPLQVVLVQPPQDFRQVNPLFVTRAVHYG